MGIEEGILALTELFGAGEAAAAGAGIAEAGAGAVGAGSFLGEGVASGIGAWDAAAAGSALGSGQFGTALSYFGQNPALIGNLVGGGGGLGGGKFGGFGGLGQIANVGSSIYGLGLANDLRKRSDPFAKYRGAYGEQLAALEANPSSITTRPGYQAGLTAVQRGSAAGGYNGSGNEIAALAQYGGNFYNQEVGRLAGLAGAGTQPGNGGYPAAMLAGQSLASLGYGLGPYSNRRPPGLFGGGG